MKEPFEITCPCCQGILTVDPVSAKVVKHSQAASRAATFDLAEEVAKLHQNNATSDQRFSDALAGHRRHQASLSSRFDDLFAKAKETADQPPPTRDIDL